MTTDSPEPLRERAEIEADLAERRRIFPNWAIFIERRLAADVGPLLERLDRESAWREMAVDKIMEQRERLDQKSAEINRLRAENAAPPADHIIVCSACHDGDCDECGSYGERPAWCQCEHHNDSPAALRSALDTARAKSADWRRLWRDRYRNLWGISEQYRAGLAAAQARAEAWTVENVAEALRVAGLEIGSVGGQSYRGYVARIVIGKLAALAGDAARPLPEPEQP